jgi:hypothetical protein
VLSKSHTLAHDKIVKDVVRVLEFVDIESTGLLNSKQTGQCMWLLKIFTDYCELKTDIEYPTFNQIEKQKADRI